MIANLVNEKVLVSGTGDILLNGANSSFTTVGSNFLNNDVIFYSVVDGSYRENGIGIYNAPGNRISRTKVFELIDAGGYQKNPVGVLNISGNAVVSVTPSIQALTTTMPTWKCVYGSLFNTGVNDPTQTSITGTILNPTFATGVVKQMGLTICMGHDIAPGTEVTLGVHWAPSDTNTGLVRWGVEMSKAKVNEVYTSSATVIMEQAPNAVPDEHLFVESASTFVVDEPGTIIQARIYREGTHPNDTYTGGAVLLGVSATYQARYIGTPKKVAPYYSWV